MKNKLLKILIFAFAFTMFIPLTKVEAGITDCPDEGECTTTSKTTLVKTETTTEEVPYDTDLDAYIANKKADSQNNNTIPVENIEEWLSLFVSENGVYKYPVHLATVFKGVTYDNDSILIGDPDEIISGTATYNYEARYREVTVTKAENPYEIKEINLTVDLPNVGDEITLNEDDDWDSQRPQANITLPSGAKYELAGSDDMNYMYYIESLDEYKPFKGIFEKGKTYYMEIWLKPLEGYFFNDDTKIYVNGEEYNKDDYEDDEIAFLYDFVPKANQKEYTLTDNGAIATFTFDSGYDFSLNIFDALTLTKEQLEEMDISEEEFNEIKEIIINNTKSYGTLLGIYSIEINDGNIGYSDSVKIKIKMTDEMKKYNSFKFIYIDDDNNFKVGDIVDFKIEGDYLTGTLPHLSAYALVGDVVEQSKINNPTTGDNIYLYFGILAISTFGLLNIKKYKKEN